MPNLLRNIPSVNELLESPPLKKLVERVSHNVVADGVRSFLGNLRGRVQAATATMHVPTPGELAERIAQWILVGEEPALRPVVNATGILLHTGLGRAPLAEEAIVEISAVAGGYASLEVDLATGERSQRVRAVERLVCRVTGAEASAVVNNNAAATVLVLAALAAGREVIVSRGQLIEIGGSFRLPEVMAAGGATLREVGTTNKTRPSDYETAIGPQTAALMRVHASNYKIVGFAEEVSLAELVAIGRKHQLPVIDDVGSGALVDFARYGLEGEPMAAESIKAGADLVLFSGDKLLGGPQCGIIAGRKNHVERVARHPLMRALRVDKLTLAALAATLRLYVDEALAERRVPLLALLSAPLENLKNRAERIAPQLAALPGVAEATIAEDQAYVGGGSIPAQAIATWCVAVRPAQGSVDALAAALRTGNPSVVGRVRKDHLLFDLRSVLPSQDISIVEAVAAACGGEKETAD
jgi:L-seryl-tRNA(Ser) seleniumtransferase